MRHPVLLDRERSVLVLIDLQEGYRTALHAWERVVVACRLLVEGMAILGVPILVTEQYPRGLGHTAPAAAQGDAAPARVRAARAAGKKRGRRGGRPSSRSVRAR